MCYTLSMTTNYEHLISKNIRAYYKKRIISPIVYVLLLIACWFLLSLSDIQTPIAYNLSQDPDLFYENESHYVVSNLENLTFTGYIATAYGKTTGYYYYGNQGDRLMIVLLAPGTCEQGLPHIDSLRINGKLMKGGSSYESLLNQLASDLAWTSDGIQSQLPTVYLSEPANHLLFTRILFALYYGSMLYALCHILLYLIHIAFPVTAPAAHDLIVFGSPRRMLNEAEEELATLPQLATEDMFITEHYFIMTSPDANAIVPIDKILWIYKHSTLHKFLWYHFSISYTMHITARKHMYIHCPKNIKSDIDGIMDYLQEANHDIVCGFSEENRLKVQAELGKPFHIEKFVALLHKRI